MLAGVVVGMRANGAISDQLFHPVNELQERGGGGKGQSSQVDVEDVECSITFLFALKLSLAGTEEVVCQGVPATLRYTFLLL